MFELIPEKDEIRVLDEKHYRLVSGESIDKHDLETMAGTAG